MHSFASRGLAVIRWFGASAPSQTLSDIARDTGLTRASARRILLTLAQLGYVQAQGRDFSLTPKILDLGFAYLCSLPLWHLTEPGMAALAADLDEPCSAAVLDGTDAVCVLRVPARGDTGSDIGIGMGIDTNVGSRHPAHATAVARMLLAGLPAEGCRARLAAAAARMQERFLSRLRDAARQVWQFSGMRA